MLSKLIARAGVEQAVRDLNDPRIPWSWRDLRVSPEVARKLDCDDVLIVPDYDKPLDIAEIRRWPVDRWNWMRISEHPGATAEVVSANLDLPWKHPFLQRVTARILREIPHDHWNWSVIGLNTDWIDIIENADMPWSWFYICRYRSDICMREVMMRPDIPWNWSALSMNVHIPWRTIIAYRDAPWVWAFVSGHPEADVDYALEHPEIDWLWTHLSGSRKLRFEQVIAHPSKGWDWSRISANRAVRPEHVRAYPELPWDWIEMSTNPNLTWKFVEENIEKQWNWFNLSNNMAIPLQDFDLTCSYLFWSAFSMREDLTVDVVREHFDKNWIWWTIIEKFPELIDDVMTRGLREKNPGNFSIAVSRWPQLTAEYIRQHREIEWAPPYITMNLTKKLEVLDEASTVRVAREYFAGCTIARAWLKCYYTPGYALWRRRMIREYLSLSRDINERQ